MIRARFFALCLGTAGALGVAVPAAAHPHVWIDVAARLTLAETGIERVTVEWTLDPMLSAVLIHDFDADRSGRLDAAEQASMAVNAFADIRAYGYFAHLRADGELVGFAGHEDFAARIEDGQVVYRFTLTPAAPVDPAAQPVALAFYDEEFYIEMMYDERSFALDGDAAGCTLSLGPDRDNPIYFGLVVPTKADVVCGAGS
jgi:ABC-type uncharacterized transport system substrate-binding protein